MLSLFVLLVCLRYLNDELQCWFATSIFKHHEMSAMTNRQLTLINLAVGNILTKVFEHSLEIFKHFFF